MVKLLLIILIFCSVKSYSQTDRNYFTREIYQKADTLSCHFLEVINDSCFSWKSGFIIRTNGLIRFGETSVSPEYLPVTSGIITSQLFYSDMTPIKNYALQVVIKPIKKP